MSVMGHMSRTASIVGIIIIIVLAAGAAFYISSTSNQDWGLSWAHVFGPSAATTTAPSEPAGGTAGAHCGGFIRNAPACAPGYHCQLVVSRPDTGGTCVSDAVSTGAAGGAETHATPQGIGFTVPAPYALVTAPETLPVQSYIPACAQGFEYCVYRAGDQYKGTTFESAGVAINVMSNLSTESTCLNTPPTGYSANTKPANTYSGDTYATSRFGNLSDAATGHYSSGQLYRLYNRTNASCTEFMAQVGQSQFANYPPGAIVQFTATDQANVEAEMHAFLSTVTVAGKAVQFPV
jgi:hypothetical protein